MDKAKTLNSSQRSTVVGGWSVAVSRALDALGCDGEGLLRDAGTDLEKSRGENTRFSSDNTRNLWNLAKQETGLEDIGLQVARFVCPTTFHALGFSLWASNSLLDALQRMVRFEVLLNDGCHLKLQNCGDGTYRFSMLIKEYQGQPLVVAEGVDYFFGAVVKMFRDMSDTGFAPLSVSLSRPDPLQAELWKEYFKCPVNFSTGTDELVFSGELLENQLPTGNALLAEQNDKLVEDYLAQMQMRDICGQVRTALMELMPLGITTLEEVAESLNIAPRTLQYKLSQQGTTLQEVRDKTREELARNYLQHSLQPFTQMAYSLGFSDPAHFNRAFKRWTGETPTAFRRRASGS